MTQEQKKFIETWGHLLPSEGTMDDEGIRETFTEDLTNLLDNWISVDTELERAIKLHPNYPVDMFQQLAIMNEEAGEVTKAVLHYWYENGTVSDIKTELIQTAAMCIRMLNALPQPPKQSTKKRGGCNP